MRKLIMWNLVSLDGYFEGPAKWDLSFHETAWGSELEELSLQQLRHADAILFGRVTYEGMATYWSTAEEQEGEVAALMNSIPKVVFSRTLERADWNNTRLVRGDPADEVGKLKQEPGKALYVFGSGQTSASLMKRGLFDEYRICVAPALLGAGSPLFPPGTPAQSLRLLEARPLVTGGVLLRYEPA